MLVCLILTGSASGAFLDTGAVIGRPKAKNLTSFASSRLTEAGRAVIIVVPGLQITMVLVTRGSSDREVVVEPRYC